MRIIPLGGLEKIGMNITAFEYEDSFDIACLMAGGLRGILPTGLYCPALARRPDLSVGSSDALRGHEEWKS